MSMGPVLLDIIKDLGVYWKTGIFMLTPILILPLPLILQSPVSYPIPDAIALLRNLKKNFNKSA